MSEKVKIGFPEELKSALKDVFKAEAKEDIETLKFHVDEIVTHQLNDLSDWIKVYSCFVRIKRSGTGLTIIISRDYTPKS